MGKKTAKKNMKFATGKVDKAQTKMIEANAKAIEELKGEVEDKYSTNLLQQQEVKFPTMGTTAERRLNIVPIDIGTTQGLTDNDRIGDRISLKMIQLRYQLNIANGGASRADIYNRIRVLMFWDNQPTDIPTSGLPNRSLPEWPQILQSIPIGIADQKPALISLSTFQNDQFPSRFTKVYDQVHTLASNGNTSTNVGTGARSCTNDIKFMQTYKNRKIVYNAGGDVALNRQLYLAYISDSTVISHPYIDWFVKCTYADS